MRTSDQRPAAGLVPDGRLARATAADSLDRELRRMALLHRRAVAARLRLARRTPRPVVLRLF